MQEDLRYLGHFIADKNHTSHPSDKALADFIDNKLSGIEKERVLAHLVDCSLCREITVNVKTNMKKPSTSNRKIFGSMLLVASLMLFIFLPREDRPSLGTIDLSIASSNNYQGMDKGSLKNKIVDADKVFKEIELSTKLSSLKYFKEANAEEENSHFQNATGFYKRAFIEATRDFDSNNRLKKKIIIHYKLMNISKKLNDKDSFNEYREIIRYEIRTYINQKEKR